MAERNYSVEYLDEHRQLVKRIKYLEPDNAVERACKVINRNIYAEISPIVVAAVYDDRDDELIAFIRAKHMVPVRGRRGFETIYDIRDMPQYAQRRATKDKLYGE